MQFLLGGSYGADTFIWNVLQTGCSSGAIPLWYISANRNGKLPSYFEGVFFAPQERPVYRKIMPGKTGSIGASCKMHVGLEKEVANRNGLSKSTLNQL